MPTMFLSDEREKKLRSRLTNKARRKGLKPDRAEEVVDKFVCEYLPAHPEVVGKPEADFNRIILALFDKAALRPAWAELERERKEVPVEPKVSEGEDGEPKVGPADRKTAKDQIAAIQAEGRIPDQTLQRAAVHEAEENDFKLIGLTWAARNDKVPFLLLAQLLFAVLKKKATLGPAEAFEIFMMAEEGQTLVVPARSRQRTSERMAREVSSIKPVDLGSAWAKALELARKARKKLDLEKIKA